MSMTVDRECNKCIHHTSGTCSSWDCKMQTVEDVKKEAVKEYVEAVVKELEKESDFFGGKAMGTLQKMYYCKGVEKAIEIVRGKE